MTFRVADTRPVWLAAKPAELGVVTPPAPPPPPRGFAPQLKATNAALARTVANVRGASAYLQAMGFAYTIHDFEVCKRLRMRKCLGLSACDGFMCR
jgi:hypothetical protein